MNPVNVHRNALATLWVAAVGVASGHSRPTGQAEVGDPFQAGLGGER